MQGLNSNSREFKSRLLDFVFVFLSAPAVAAVGLITIFVVFVIVFFVVGGVAVVGIVGVDN